MLGAGADAGWDGVWDEAKQSEFDEATSHERLPLFFKTHVGGEWSAPFNTVEISTSVIKAVSFFTYDLFKDEAELIATTQKYCHSKDTSFECSQRRDATRMVGGEQLVVGKSLTLGCRANTLQQRGGKKKPKEERCPFKVLASSQNKERTMTFITNQIRVLASSNADDAGEKLEAAKAAQKKLAPNENGR